MRNVIFINNHDHWPWPLTVLALALALASNMLSSNPSLYKTCKTQSVGHKRHKSVAYIAAYIVGGIGVPFSAQGHKT